ncbi:FmdB family zinc ribbon protein [Noviherbaspirillum sp.]|uniref:FmdB family zinc ribbon protein n=1 Tax=Noviherbaspirillum sp. TaxID=1926288 RepID=UPI002FE1E194
MPLYDIHCSHCAGTFEKMLPVSRLHKPTECPYCRTLTAAAPAVSAGRVALRSIETWKPRNLAEQLAGMGATGPGSHAKAGRSSVLHNCKGFNCSICDT